jgi:hypothetical protein
MQGILPAGHLPGDRRPGGLRNSAPSADGLTVESMTNSVESLLDAAGIPLREQDGGGERESRKKKDELKKVLTENLRLKEELARERLQISRAGLNYSVKDDHLPAAARVSSGEFGRARASSGELSDLGGAQGRSEAMKFGELGGPRTTWGEVATKTWCGSKKKPASTAFEKGKMPAQVRQSVSSESTFLGAAAAQRRSKAEEEQGDMPPPFGVGFGIPEAVSTNLSMGFDEIRKIVQAIEKAPKGITRRRL